MEDYRLPALLVRMLKATRLTGIPRIQTDLQTAKLAVTITWELASSTTKKKTTKPPASKKTAPAKKSPSPSTESSEPPKSSTPPPSPKPTPPPSPKPKPTPSPPKPTPPSPKKANRLHENVQRLTKVATRQLAQQGGLTPEPNPTTQQPSAPCPEVLPPQVTARQVGPPPTAVSTVKQPPSPMQVDFKPPQHIPPVPLNYRAKDYLQFLSKGNRQGKVFAVNGNPAEVVVQYNRSNGRPPHFVKYCDLTGRSYVLKAPDSKYHVPAQWEAASEICKQLSHSQARKSLPCDKKIILSNIAKSPFYRAFPTV